MTLEEDNHKGVVKKEMGFQKEDQYPCLLIDSASDAIPSADLSTLDDIIYFLQKEGFISDHRSHSAKEK